MQTSLLSPTPSPWSLRSRMPSLVILSTLTAITVHADGLKTRPDPTKGASQELIDASRAGTITVDQIMEGVAANQDRMNEAREAFIYKQDLRLKLIRTNSEMAREEHHIYNVFPTKNGIEKTVDYFEGKYNGKGRSGHYDKPGFQLGDPDIDGELIEDLADDLTNDKGSKDGIDVDLFPLRREKLHNYKFELKGEREYRDRKVYVVEFEPKNDKDFGWAGELFVDRTELQPLMVSTHLSRGIPFLVRTLLGTNVKQVGFQVSYDRFGNGVWFPVSYGTEFGISALFFYKRTIAVSLKNYDFKQTSADSTIRFGEQIAEQKP